LVDAPRVLEGSIPDAFENQQQVGASDNLSHTTGILFFLPSCRLSCSIVGTLSKEPQLSAAEEDL
jgi:hypothetical protein